MTLTKDDGIGATGVPFPVGRQPRFTRVSITELAELRALADQATAAYSAGFADGRERLAEELGIALPRRLRTEADILAAYDAAMTVRLMATAHQMGYAEGLAAARGQESSSPPPRALHIARAGTNSGGTA